MSTMVNMIYYVVDRFFFPWYRTYLLDSTYRVYHDVRKNNRHLLEQQTSVPKLDTLTTAPEGCYNPQQDCAITERRMFRKTM